MARLFKLVSVLQSMRIWVILGVFPVANGAAGRSSCTCLAACLGSELGGSKVWEWSPAGMPRWFSRRLRTFLSSPALACSGGSLPSEALSAPRCPTAGGSAGRSAALSRSQAKPPGASSHALVAAPVSACLEVPASAAPPGFSLSCGFAGVRASEILVLCWLCFVSCLPVKRNPPFGYSHTCRVFFL